MRPHTTGSLSTDKQGHVLKGIAESIRLFFKLNHCLFPSFPEDYLKIGQRNKFENTYYSTETPLVFYWLNGTGRSRGF